MQIVCHLVFGKPVVYQDQLATVFSICKVKFQPGIGLILTKVGGPPALNDATERFELQIATPNVLVAAIELPTNCRINVGFAAVAHGAVMHRAQPSFIEFFGRNCKMCLQFNLVHDEHIVIPIGLSLNREVYSFYERVITMLWAVCLPDRSVA